MGPLPACSSACTAPASLHEPNPASSCHCHPPGTLAHHGQLPSSAPLSVAVPSARPGSVPAVHPPEVGSALEQLWAASESATGRAGQGLMRVLPYGRAVLAFALHLVQFDSGNPAVVFYPIREDASRVCSVTQSMLFSLWKKKHLLNKPSFFSGCGERKLCRDQRHSTVRGTRVLQYRISAAVPQLLAPQGWVCGHSAGTRLVGTCASRLGALLGLPMGVAPAALAPSSHTVPSPGAARGHCSGASQASRSHF